MDLSARSPIWTLSRRQNKTTRTKHDWTLEQMEALCLLKFYFSLLPSEISIVLNARFPNSAVPFTTTTCTSRLANLSRGDRLRQAHAAWKTISRTINGEIPAKYHLAVQSLRELMDKLQIRPRPPSNSLAIQRQRRQKRRRGAKRKSIPQKARARSSRLVGPSDLADQNETDDIKDEIVVKISLPHSTETAVTAQSPQKHRRGLHSAHTVNDSRSVLPSSSAQIDLIKAEPGTDTPLSRRLAVKVQVSTPISRSIDTASRSAPCPRLLFRTYCNKSAGINGLNGFVAGRFDPEAAKVKLPIYAPPEGAITSPAFLNNAFHHLKRRTDGTPFGSTFISFTPSLVWVIFRAFKTENQQPHISAIDGPKAAFTTSIYAVAPVIEALKDQNMWPGYRYSALYEFLVWGKVEPSAIIHDFTLAELQELATRRKAAREFLRLQLFENRRNMWTLRYKLFEEPLTLDANIGKALGELLVFFGLTPTTSTEDTICTLLYSLLQGWAIHPPLDWNCRQASLEAFRKVFKVDRCSQTKVDRAFNNAVDCAHEEICQERNERLREEQRKLLKS